MKASTNKTNTRSESGTSKSTEKASRGTAATARETTASRGTAKAQTGTTAKTSRSNNPEGHNQYAKK